MKNPNREGGATGYGTGNLRYKLPEVIPFNFGADYPATTGIKRQRLILKGLSSLLNVQIHVAIRPNEGNSNPELDYPALPGTVQVTPFATMKGGAYLYLKPLGLVPQTIPHQFDLGGPQRQGGSGALAVGGNFGTSGGDGCLIDILIDTAEYADEVLSGALYVFVQADYNGNWWDVDAIQTLFGKLILTNAPAVKIHTAVG